MANSIWPTEAAACLSSNFLNLCLEILFAPNAIAPEHTITIFCFIQSAISLYKLSSHLDLIFFVFESTIEFEPLFITTFLYFLIICDFIIFE